MPGNHRRVLLIAALAAVRVKSREPELALVHALLDSWRGLGLLTAGMRRHGYDLSLTSDASGWRATFPSPEPFHAAVGGPSPQLVADSLASRAGGRVAGAEHAV